MFPEIETLFCNPQDVTADDVSAAVLLLADSPVCRLHIAGYSLRRRPLYALEIGAMIDPVLIVGGTHAMEWASVLVALQLAAQTEEAVRLGYPVHGMDLGAMLLRRGAVFLPLLNPDGFEIRRGASTPRPAIRPDAPASRWQANARGVDLNHNFNAGFYKARRIVRAGGIRRPGPTRYGGAIPFSEPETRAVRHLCAKIRPRTLYALHSQGEEIYWRYGGAQPEGSAYIGKLLASLTGYRLCDPDAAASHAGMKDWFIKRYRRPGFTMELGLGENPLPYADYPAIWSRVERAMFVALVI